nr:MAG TPA: putative small protein [Podoviridae sp. ctgx11]
MKKLTKYDLNIGDVVRSRSLGWEFTITDISTCLGSGPTEAELVRKHNDKKKSN